MSRIVDLNEYVGTEQARRMLRLPSLAALRKLIERGRLPALRIGRSLFVARSAIAGFVKQPPGKHLSYAQPNLSVQSADRTGR